MLINLLKLLPPESAHQITIKLLKLNLTISEKKTDIGLSGYGSYASYDSVRTIPRDETVRCIWLAMSCCRGSVRSVPVRQRFH